MKGPSLSTIWQHYTVVLSCAWSSLWMGTYHASGVESLGM